MRSHRWKRFSLAALVLVAGCFRSDNEVTSPEPEPPSPVPEIEQSEPVSTPATPAIATVRDEPVAQPQVEIVDAVIVMALASDDPAARSDAAAHFEKLGDKGVAQLVDATRSDNAEVRKGAVFFLMGKVGTHHDEVSTVMAQSLEDPDRSIRHLGLQMVRFFSLDTLKASLPRLAEMLDHTQEEQSNRLAVARILKGLQASKELVLPALTTASASDPNEQVRSACIDAVFELGTPEQFVPVLEHALRTETRASIRRNAAKRLELADAAAEPAIATIASRLGDDDEDVRESCTRTMLQLGEVGINDLLDQLKSGNRSAKLRSLYVLGKLGSATLPHLSSIQAAAKDSDPEVQKLASQVAKYLERLKAKEEALEVLNLDTAD